MSDQPSKGMRWEYATTFGGGEPVALCDGEHEWHGLPAWYTAQIGWEATVQVCDRCGVTTRGGAMRVRRSAVPEDDGLPFWIGALGFR